MSGIVQQEIPEGYKQTEVGVIPDGWDCIESKEAINFCGGYGFSSRLAASSGVRWLKIANVGLNEIKWGAESFLPKYLKHEFKNYDLKNDDVVMALTRPILGDKLKVARIGINDIPALLNQRVARLDVKSFHQIDFLYYVVQRLNFVAAMNLSMAGTDPPNIGTVALGKIKIAVPSDEKEQTAIANALTDVDALITSLEKLITKKHAIKTAAMQQLLTGKKRLPPFDRTHTSYKQTELGEIPKDWEVKSIGVALSIRHGRDQKQVETQDGIYPILGTGGEMGKTDTFLYDKSSVLIGRKGTINKPVYMDSPFWTVDTLFYSEVSEKYLAKFIYYKFCVIDWMSYNEASGVPSLNASTIENILQSFPNNREEQIAIANVLSDMDKDIDALEQRLTKTQQLKQGMMQELLTGRIRLTRDKGK